MDIELLEQELELPESGFIQHEAFGNIVECVGACLQRFFHMTIDQVSDRLHSLSASDIVVMKRQFAQLALTSDPVLVSCFVNTRVRME